MHWCQWIFFQRTFNCIYYIPKNSLRRAGSIEKRSGGGRDACCGATREQTVSRGWRMDWKTTLARVHDGGCLFINLRDIDFMYLCRALGRHITGNGSVHVAYDVIKLNKACKLAVADNRQWQVYQWKCDKTVTISYNRLFSYPPNT